MESHWRVYLDESGRFDGSDEPACIGGLMLQERDVVAFNHVAWQRLQTLVPYAKWPLHAAHLRSPTFHVAAWLRSGGDVYNPGWPALATAASRLEASAATDSAVADVLASVASDGHDDLVALRACDAWYDALGARDPGARKEFDGLRQVVSDWARGTRDLLETLARGYNTDPTSPRAFVVGAWDSPHATPLPGDRWLRVAEALVERVFALLRTDTSARHTVYVTCAAVDVRADATGGRTPLSEALLRGVIERAAKFPPRDVSAMSASVRIVAEAPRRYFSEATPAGLVLSDFIVNRLRMPMSNRPTWADFCQRAVEQVGLPVDAGVRVLKSADLRPTVAYEGEARRLVTLAFARRSEGIARGSRRDPAISRVWPGCGRDQAEQWIALAEES